MENLPLEAQFAHTSLMANAERMSKAQLIEALESINLARLSAMETLKTVMGASLGIESAVEKLYGQRD